MTILLDSIGGSMIEVERGRVECVYPGRFITGLLVLPIILCGLGGLAMLIASIVDVNGGPLFGLLPAAFFVAVLGYVVRYRLRTMGRFVVDGPGGELRRVGKGGLVIARHPLAEARFERRWDPFHRSFGFQHWLLARCGDATYRLGKGDASAVDRARARLEALRDAR